MLVIALLSVSIMLVIGVAMPCTAFFTLSFRIVLIDAISVDRLVFAVEYLDKYIHYTIGQ